MCQQSNAVQKIHLSRNRQMMCMNKSRRKRIYVSLFQWHCSYQNCQLPNFPWLTTGPRSWENLRNCHIISLGENWDKYRLFFFKNAHSPIKNIFPYQRAPHFGLAPRIRPAFSHNVWSVWGVHCHWNSLKPRIYKTEWGIRHFCR